MATNTENGKCYVGMTTRSLQRRKADHLNSAKSGVNYRFYNAIRKYGADVFSWEILFEAEDAQTLFSVEQKYIDRFDCVSWGYNQCYGGAGVVPTAELRKHKSDSTKLLYENKQYVANRMQGIREYWNTPEAHKMATTRARENAKNPKWIQSCKDSWTDSAREQASQRMTDRMARVKNEDPDFFRRRALCITPEIRARIGEASRNRWKNISDEDRNTVSDRLRETMKTSKWKDAVKLAAEKNCRKVQCVETGVIYASIKQAADKCNTTNQNINAVLHGKQHTTRGLTFIYYEGDING